MLPVSSQVGRGKPVSACAAASAQGTVCSLYLQGTLLVTSAGLDGGECRRAGLVFVMRVSRPPSGLESLRCLQSFNM